MERLVLWRSWYLWVYYSAQIFLLGAEYTRAYAESHGSHANKMRQFTAEPAANAIAGFSAARFTGFFQTEVERSVGC